MHFDEAMHIMQEACSEAIEGDLAAIKTLRGLLRYASRKGEDELIVEVCQFLLDLITEYKEDS